MKRLLLSVLLFLLAGCAGRPCMKTQIVEVGNRYQVADCQLLHTFTWPGGGLIFEAPYTGNFKDEAIAQAEKIGATHILYRSEIDGNGVGVTGVVYAYKCPPSYEPPAARHEPDQQTAPPEPLQ